MNMTRQEMIFEVAQRQAKHDNLPFPYANMEEWMADEPLRRAEIERERNRLHYWLADYPPSPDELSYKFRDPITDRQYCINLHHGTTDQCWSVELSYDNGEPDGWNRWLNPDLYVCYYYDDLPALKADLIQLMKTMFPSVSGWNDDFHVIPGRPIDLHYQFHLYPREFIKYFDYDMRNGDAPIHSYLLGDIQLIGRSGCSETEEIKGKFLHSSKSDIAGVTVGSNLNCVMPSEMALLGDGSTENVFYHRYSQKRLQVFASASGSTKKPIGDEISENSNIMWTVDGVKKFIRRIDWSEFSYRCPDTFICETTLREFRDKWDWKKISDRGIVNNNWDLLEKFADEIDWSTVINNWNIEKPDEFLNKFQSHIPMAKLQDSRLWEALVEKRAKQLMCEAIGAK